MRIFDNIDIEVYGSSHSQKIGFKLKGVKSGYVINNKKISILLEKRKGNPIYNTTRNENEKFIFLSGVENGVTTGDAIHCEVKQTNFKSTDYEKGVVRPSHADLSAYIKFGFNYNYKGGGEFSGRMTMLYVIAGEIARQILWQKNNKVEIFYNIEQVLNFKDEKIMFKTKDECIENDKKKIPIFDNDTKKKVENLLKKLKDDKDSVGGKLTFKIFEVPHGLGDVFFNSFESKLSAAIFSTPAVKSIEFGIGNEFLSNFGSKFLEELEATSNGEVVSKTNYNGGINGGITNGITPVLFSTVIKPTATLTKEITTVKYNHSGKFENITTQITGRHDAFIANRAAFSIMGLTYLIFLDYIDK